MITAREVESLIQSVSDSTLNGLIKDLVGVYGSHNNEMLEQALLDEWEKRHPTKISPAMEAKAMIHGGYPAQYAGRTLTMEMECNEDFPVP